MPCDEGRPPRRTALIGVIVGKAHPLVGNAIDIGCAVAHDPVAICTDIRYANVVNPEHQDVGFVGRQSDRRSDHNAQSACDSNDESGNSMQFHEILLPRPSKIDRSLAQFAEDFQSSPYSEHQSGESRSTPHRRKHQPTQTPRIDTFARVDRSGLAAPQDPRDSLKHLDGRIDLGLAKRNALDIAAQRNPLLACELVQLLKAGN